MGRKGVEGPGPTGKLEKHPKASPECVMRLVERPPARSPKWNQTNDDYGIRPTMIADHLTGIEKFEADLWKVADDLRANSGLASNEYFMPIMGLLFLRQATNRYHEALATIEADKKAGKISDREPVAADFTRCRALMLPKSAL